MTPGMPKGLEVLTVPAEGAQYRGVIVIEWPAPYGTGPYSAMNGWKVTVADAVTGKPIPTCTSITVHVDPGALVTAGLTMFTDAGGEPLLDGDPVRDGDGFRTGVFPFVVSEMRVRSQVVPGMREIPDPQAEMERLAAARLPGAADAAVRALLTRKYAFTKQQIDALTPDQVALLLADDSKESE